MSDNREQSPNDEELPADATEMTEGIGGMPDLEPTERATVSDVDGDNVETDRPKPEA